MMRISFSLSVNHWSLQILATLPQSALIRNQTGSEIKIVRT
jgi:hypothetical protein